MRRRDPQAVEAGQCNGVDGFFNCVLVNVEGSEVVHCIRVAETLKLQVFLRL